MRTFLFFLSQYRQLLIVKWRLMLAIKLANIKHFINDKRYFVLPEPRTKGLITVNNDEIKHYKKKGVIDKRKGMLELSQIAFYQTATKRYGKDAPTPEEKKEMAKRYYRYTGLTNFILKKSRVGLLNAR